MRMDCAVFDKSMKLGTGVDLKLIKKNFEGQCHVKFFL